MPEELPAAGPYRCPGESYPISRAVHLGRLVHFYPACRACPRRDEHRLLSPRQIRRLAEVQRRAEPFSLFCEEGVAAVYWNQLRLSDARELAMAMGYWLRQQPGHGAAPTALVAGDGRPLTPEVVSAVVEGFRWAGCFTIEIASATAACAALAVSQLACDGGILVGNPLGTVQTVGLKFWGPEGRPLSRGSGLEAIEQVFQRGVDRPTRCFGGLRRFPAEATYLAGLMEFYHALRPLRFVLASECRPLARYVESLLDATACQCLGCPTAWHGLPEQIRQAEASFGVHVDDDGERLVAYDERGQAVAAERLAAMVIEELLAENPEPRVVLEAAIAGPLAARFGRRLQPVVCTSPSRAAMRQLLGEHLAVFGGGADGRFWYRLGEACWAADALRTLTLLLRHLSRSDRPLSAVLDAPGTGD